MSNQDEVKKSQEATENAESNRANGAGDQGFKTLAIHENSDCCHVRLAPGLQTPVHEHELNLPLGMVTDIIELCIRAISAEWKLIRNGAPHPEADRIERIINDLVSRLQEHDCHGVEKLEAKFFPTYGWLFPGTATIPRANTLARIKHLESIIGRPSPSEDVPFHYLSDDEIEILELKSRLKDIEGIDRDITYAQPSPTKRSQA